MSLGRTTEFQIVVKVDEFRSMDLSIIAANLWSFIKSGF